MKESKFPEGWDESRVRRLLASYEAETEEEIVAEDEAGVEQVETVVSIPYDLLPQIRELIAKCQS
ncbi:MAG: hypothetical protein M3Y72_17770 [Acidobacteriota bacterium]|nr:hypothetical protein [Acidobacteriota bacterium]